MKQQTFAKRLNALGYVERNGVFSKKGSSVRFQIFGNRAKVWNALNNLNGISNVKYMNFANAINHSDGQSTTSNRPVRQKETGYWNTWGGAKDGSYYANGNLDWQGFTKYPFPGTIFGQLLSIYQYQKFGNVDGYYKILNRAKMVYVTGAEYEKGDIFMPTIQQLEHGAIDYGIATPRYENPLEVARVQVNTGGGTTPPPVPPPVTPPVTPPVDEDYDDEKKDDVVEMLKKYWWIVVIVIFLFLKKQ